MKSDIKIELTLDNNRVPEKIEWMAADSDMKTPKESKAMMLAFWDSEEKQTLGIDLWTDKMSVDEMNIFIFQALIKMSDTYKKATHNEEASKMLQAFADEFAQTVNSK